MLVKFKLIPDEILTNLLVENLILHFLINNVEHILKANSAELGLSVHK